MTQETDGSAGVVAALRATVDEGLRSVTIYDCDGYAVLFMRDDVRALYSPDEIAAAADELRLQALERDYLNSVFSGVHGDVESSVTVFENAVEMNVLLSATRGVSVAVDHDRFEDTAAIAEVVSAAVTDADWAQID